MRLKFTLGRKRGKERGVAEAGASKLPRELPRGARLISAGKSGVIYFYEGMLHVEPLEEDPVWGKLTPLFTANITQEVWMLPHTVVATIQGLGRVAVNVETGILEDIITRLVAETGTRVDLRRPYNATEYRGWRVSIQLPPAGQMEIVATRVQRVPPLTRLVDPLLAARLLLLLLRPSTVVIAGPPGSGKTTLLNSLTVEAARLWPHLHVAVVERHKELVLNGGWASRMVGPLGDVIRYVIRYKRPDVLVVGELATDDVWSFIEAGKGGTPTISTYHSPNVFKTVRTIRDALRLHLGEIDERKVLNYIDVFVMTEKTVTLKGIERRVSAAYVSDGQRLVPVFVEGRHAPEEEFERMLPERLVVGSADKVKAALYEALGVGSMARYVVEPLEPVLVA